MSVSEYFDAEEYHSAGAHSESSSDDCSSNSGDGETTHSDNSDATTECNDNSGT